MRKSNKTISGSITVEATIVVSTVILILMMIIYSFLIMYQKILLKNTAELVAHQGAQIWTDNRKAFNTGTYDFTKKQSLKDFYNGLFDLNNKYELTTGTSIYESKQLNSNNIQDTKLIQMKSAIEKELNKSILSSESTSIQFDFQNLIVQKKLSVTLSQEVKFPMGNFLTLLNNKRTITLKGTSTSIITEPTEYIRNIDLGVEYASKLLDSTGIPDKLEELKNKFGGE